MAAQLKSRLRLLLSIDRVFLTYQHVAIVRAIEL